MKTWILIIWVSANAPGNWSAAPVTVDGFRDYKSCSVALDKWKQRGIKLYDSYKLKIILDREVYENMYLGECLEKN